ncbi:MAG: hypothetical protein M1832_000113 [Thelocarpon impressellum]|nr:MAG: hypothetical protein M1832_000113 [Thelocarpon impressellum]
MASKHAALAVPATAALPHSLRLPATSARVVATISRVPRPSLIDLVLGWLDDENQARCGPYLVTGEDEDEADDSVYPAARSLDQLRQLYEGLPRTRGSKREVAERILEGDWRHGVTLYQLAMADMRYLTDRPGALKWAAMKLEPLQADGEARNDMPADPDDTAGIPRFHAPTFLQNLQREVAPVVKAHYYLMRTASPPVTFLRVYIHDSPYSNYVGTRGDTRPSGSKTVYVAFPDGAPHVYVSIVAAPGQVVGGEGRSLRKVVLEALAKALSRPQSRFCLRPTALVTKSLSALLAMRGAGRGNGAHGGWSIFADGSVDGSPLDERPPETSKRTYEDDDDKENEGADAADPLAKRRKALTAGRFGSDGVASTDKKALERVVITLEDAFPRLPHSSSTAEDDEPWKPSIRLTFSGAHVIAGIRALADAGLVDAARMPGWMTGEAAVSAGVVRDGRVVRGSGSGLA